MSGLPASLTGRIAVLLPVALDRPFDYLLKEGISVSPGQFVRVPLRGRGSVTGVVWGAGSTELGAKSLKPVEDILDMPPLTPDLLRFIAWVADYTLSPLGMVLRMVLSVPAALQPKPQQVVYHIADNGPNVDPTPKRAQVLRVLADGRALTLRDLAHEAGVGEPVVRAMAKAGLLEGAAVARADPRRDRDLDPAFAATDLSPVQAIAANRLRDFVRNRTFSVALLDGVTGSGKTEVYFEAIAEALAQGRQALILLPEIALSAQFIDRFKPRFGATPALWHSDLTPAQRRKTWRGVLEGTVRVVIGARSALFLPFAELGLIVVDEENDTGYKQEDVVIYHARDMAVVRAKQEGFPIVLVSATPSLETMANVEAGRYAHLTLPARYGGATLPEISLIDLRVDKPPPKRFLSPVLVEAVRRTLAANEQALLFLNRRGYAPLTLCRACGHRMKCPNCTAWLVEHRSRDRLVCHYCGHAEHLPGRCPHCEAEQSFAPVGPGVERIAEEAETLFPEARILQMASDLMDEPGSLPETLRRIAGREVDLIVGTQIIAKGHHFPTLTLVGVVDADLGLSGGDLRAGERTYQLLQQVSGRAGRASHPGRAMIQTYDPGHQVMQALLSGDRDRFLAVEMGERKQAGQPPFTRLAALIVSSDDAMAAERAAVELGRVAPHQGHELYTLGPAPAPLSLLRNRYRYRLLLKAPKTVSIQSVVRDWLARVTIPNDVRVQVDIDPYGFL